VSEFVTTARPRDPAARLRAAAAAGDLGAIQTLLKTGSQVDAADGEGETALMAAIQSDQPAAAALLRRHGASLDRRDKAGTSARDMAEQAGDPALRQALGLAP
jgi:ankyrin repeat protein